MTRVKLGAVRLSPGKVKQSKFQQARKVLPTGSRSRGHRYRPGTVALQEIRRYQKGADLLIRRAPFQRLVREILQEIQKPGGDFRIQPQALEALQESAEAFLVGSQI